MNTNTFVLASYVGMHSPGWGKLFTVSPRNRFRNKSMSWCPVPGSLAQGTDG